MKCGRFLKHSRPICRPIGYKYAYSWSSLNMHIRWSAIFLLLSLTQTLTRNVGRCPTWWPPCGICGALCESSVIAFLVTRRKVWLAPASGVPCSNAANRRTQDFDVSLKWILHRAKFCLTVRGIKDPQKCRHSVPCSPGDGQTSCTVWLASGERRRCMQ